MREKNTYLSKEDDFLKKSTISLKDEDVYLPKRIETIRNLIAYLALIVIAVLQVYNVKNFEGKMVSLGLVLAFGIIWAFFLTRGEPGLFMVNLFLMIECIIIIIPLILGINWGAFFTLFFMLSAYVMMAMPDKRGLLWISIFLLIILIGCIIDYGFYPGLIVGFADGAATLFFAGFGYAVSIAEKSREKTLSLLKELQEVHEQLKDYTMKVEELIVLEERNRLSRELHDSLGHSLTVLSLDLEILKKIIKKDSKRAEKIIDTIKDETKNALSNLRKTVVTLRMPVEEDFPIFEGIKATLKNFEDAAGVKINLYIDENLPDLPIKLKTSIHRVIQEALTNIEKHSAANEVWINLNYKDSKLRLVIEDNGKGFSSRTIGSGFGLMGIKERSLRLNGEFKYENRENGGARLIFEIPSSCEGNDG